MLKKLIGQITEKEFFTEFWGKKSIILKSRLSHDILLTKEKFFEILIKSNLEFPRVTCMNDAGQVPITEYADITPFHVSPKIISKKVQDLADRGNTVRIRCVNQFDDSIKLLRNKLIEIFKFNVTTNAYYSSSPASGINLHYDIRHTFIVQLEGQKEWSIGDKINQVPRHDFRPFTDTKNYQVKETFNLNPGEILYIPPGLWHQTKTLKPNYSLHLAIGVTMPDWYDMLKVYTTHMMKKYPIFRDHINFNVKDDKVHYKENLEKDLKLLLEMMVKELPNYDFYQDIEEEVRKKP